MSCYLYMLDLVYTYLIYADPDFEEGVVLTLLMPKSGVNGNVDMQLILISMLLDEDVFHNIVA